MKKMTHGFRRLAFGLSLILLVGACNQDEPILPQPGENGSFTGPSRLQIIEDEIAGVPLIILGSQGLGLAIAFRSDLDGNLRTFTPLQNQYPLVMEDELGNRWDAFGRAVSGPDQGRQLEYVNSGMGFWFVFGAMYPGLEIYQQGGRDARTEQDTLEGWNIPTTAVAQGSGFDGITSLNRPEFFTFNVLEVDPGSDFFLQDDDLVVVVAIGGENRVYPHAILDWHEVINDEIAGIPISVTYCPLTGTAKVWERSGASINTSFGVSGLLYNSNVLPFDRLTESYWHQLEGRSVFGDRIGEQLTLRPHLETTWGNWKRLEPNPLLMSTNTGIDRDYTQYPYGDYQTSELIAYPLAFEDDRLPKKERVFCVIVEGKAKVYRLSDF